MSQHYIGGLHLSVWDLKKRASFLYYRLFRVEKVAFFSALQAPQHNPLPTAPIDSPTLRLQPPPTGCPAALSRLLVPPLVPTMCRHFHPSRRRLLVGYAATRLDTLFIPRPAPLLSPLPPRSSAHLFHSRDPSSRPPIGVNNVSPLPPLAPPSPGRFCSDQTCHFTYSAHLFHSRCQSSRPSFGVNNVSPFPPRAPPSPAEIRSDNS